MAGMFGHSCEQKFSFAESLRASCSCIGKTAPQKCEISVFQIPLIEHARADHIRVTFHLQIKTPNACMKTKG